MSWQKILQVCVLGIAMVYTLALVETDSMDWNIFSRLLPKKSWKSIILALKDYKKIVEHLPHSILEAFC
jgi:hypothetical protein